MKKNTNYNSISIENRTCVISQYLVSNILEASTLYRIFYILNLNRLRVFSRTDADLISTTLKESKESQRGTHFMISKPSS
jgi:hypothetical protein